jgi:Putative auto-transporter adhesin, head GIN domain
VKGRLLAIVLLLTAALPMSSCVGVRTLRGSGRLATEQREVSGVTGVELATLAKLTIRLGDNEELRIEGDDNLLPAIQTSMSEGILTIKGRRGVTLLPRESLSFDLTVRTLDSVILSALGTIEMPADLRTAQLSATITGGGKVTLHSVEADRLQLNISGLGYLLVNGGQVGEQSVVISGGGNYQAQQLQSDRADIQLSGLGLATVRVREQLKVAISGGGLVTYVGSPTVEQSISGIGRLERIEE